MNNGQKIGGWYDAIFPHMNVFENIAFGLRLRKVAEA